jgi:hypothetical protein
VRNGASGNPPAFRKGKLTWDKEEEARYVIYAKAPSTVSLSRIPLASMRISVILAEMTNPNIRTTFLDERHTVTFHLMAYRQLTLQEAVDTVHVYRSQSHIRRRKTPERNKLITIMTVIGG